MKDNQNEMEELVSVSVTVGERQYPLKIRAEDDALVREAEQLINEKFKEFQLRFTGQEKIDYLAMSALMIAVDLLKRREAGGAETEVLFQKISDAEKMIADLIKRV